MEENDPLENQFTEISEINKFIYLGSFAHPCSNSEEFQKLQINVVINCAAEIDYPCPLHYIFEKFPLENDEYASMLEYMDKAVEKIHRYLSQHKKIYIHCNNGNSRAPAILIYYLMVHKKFNYSRALSLLKKLRPTIMINDNFERELKTIEEC